MRIIGIDPGIATIGFGVVSYHNNRCILEKCGVITTPAHTSLSSRLSRIYSDLTELLQMFQPDAVSIEELFFTNNITTGIPVAHGRGVIVMEMVRRICSLTAVPRPDDAADAVALAICHARSSTSLLMNEGDSNPCSTI